MHPNRWDALKCVALLSMFIDHTGWFFFDDITAFRAVGRAAAFIFLFLTGIAPHYKIDKTLILLALLLTLNDWLVTQQPNTLNILCTILLLRAIFLWLERSGRTKLKLHEWTICCVLFLYTTALTQYGAIGLLIGLSGFVYKHRVEYAPTTPNRFMATTFTVYGAIMAYLLQLDVGELALMIATLLITWRLTHWFLQAPKAQLACPAGTGQFIVIMSRYSGYIYVIHLIVLGWFTGKAT